MYVFESVIAPHSHTHDSVDSRLTARTSSSNRVVSRFASSRVSLDTPRQKRAGYREMSTAAVRRERRPSRRVSSRASSAMRSKSAAVGAPSTTPGGDAGAAESELRSKRAASTFSSPSADTRLARQLGQVVFCASHPSMQSLWNACWHSGRHSSVSPTSNASMHTEHDSSSTLHFPRSHASLPNATRGIASTTARGHPRGAFRRRAPFVMATSPQSSSRPTNSTPPNPPPLRRMARANRRRHTESTMHTNMPMITTSTTVMNPGLVIAYSSTKLD
mmetsp:Transcript_2263/g.9412  ORF Transcript_2263/g.9412 Transcript_2263/m.9412 type:complete len:275 (+) Transcript_2263:73-897(+)